MRLPSSPHRITGVVIPVSSLRTQRSCGSGEFADIVPFAEFCAKAGVSLIQLLPVNDTGTESSPYSALSAFALNPLYLSLRDLPEAEPFQKEINAIRDAHDSRERFDYRSLRAAKMDVLYAIFDSREKEIIADPSLERWIAANPWISDYAVFMNLKRRNLDASWKEWPKMRTPSRAEIRDRWESPARKSTHLFYAWLQMRLDGQFSQAVAECAKLGVYLKGDIPILMNEDSCDAWALPEFFRDDLRAGSPPDDMNPLGQNWGFPIYNWDNMREDGFSWWKARLRTASRYYAAFRIDHILGFFRIWSVPEGNDSGVLGWTTPHEPITFSELASRGYSGDRLRWVTEPHVPTRVVEDANGHDYLAAHGSLKRVMDRVGAEELWTFKGDIRGERAIRGAGLPDAVAEALVSRWRDRLLQITGRDEAGKPLYCPIWNYRDTTAWKSLSDGERADLERLFSEKLERGERLWRAQAVELLGTLVGDVDMLPCAEDLGSIPACVPDVLAELGIYGLKVARWERAWNAPGQPLRPFTDYPELSVATTSVHDSSTLRGWWDDEGGADALLAYWRASGVAVPETGADKKLTPEIARRVLSAVARARSRILSVPLQDFLALSSDYYGTKSENDRINIPGSVTAFNWTWRIPVRVDALKKDKRLIGAIADIAREHAESMDSSRGEMGASK